MKARRPKTSHLEIGIGSGRRLRQVASQGRHGKVVGIDKRRRAVRTRIPGAKLVLGGKGEAKAFLRDTIRRKERFDEINAEYLFDSIVPEVDVATSLAKGVSFQRIIDEMDARKRKRNAEITETLELIKKVLKRNGILRTEVRKDSLQINVRRLRRHGFQTQTKKLKPEEIESVWGKKYLKQAIEGDKGKWPHEITARLQ